MNDPLPDGRPRSKLRIPTSATTAVSGQRTAAPTALTPEALDSYRYVGGSAAPNDRREDDTVVKWRTVVDKHQKSARVEFLNSNDDVVFVNE